MFSDLQGSPASIAKEILSSAVRVNHLMSALFDQAELPALFEFGGPEGTRIFCCPTASDRIVAMSNPRTVLTMVNICEGRIHEAWVFEEHPFSASFLRGLAAQFGLRLHGDSRPAFGLQLHGQEAHVKGSIITKTRTLFFENGRSAVITSRALAPSRGSQMVEYVITTHDPASRWAVKTMTTENETHVITPPERIA